MVNYIRKNFGVNLISKRAFVEKRLDKILHDTNYTNLTEFMDFVEKNKAEKVDSSLISMLVTNHTFFMREKMHFDLLSQVVIPKLYKNKNKKKGIKIWSAATSSGQEAYTSLMILLDFLKDEASEWNIEIIGTDVSELMIKRARKGEYSKEELESVSKEWIRKYFTAKINGGYRINDCLKDYITFKRLNLVMDIQFDQVFQVIFLRNVLIYFDGALVNQVVDKVADYLETGGYLFIGVKETIEINSDKLICIQPSVYRKI